MAVDYNEDLFQRVVGVHWRKPGALSRAPAVILVEDWGNILHRVEFQPGKHFPKIQDVSLPEAFYDPSPENPPTCLPTGGSFAFVGGNTNTPPTPAFVVCGTSTFTTDIDFGFGNTAPWPQCSSWIYHSQDGLSWTKVYEESKTTTTIRETWGMNGGAVVWDPADKLFYRFYNVIHVVSSGVAGVPGTTNVFHKILQSSDGIRWGLILDTDLGANTDYRSPFETVHCAHNSCVDEKGQHVPDGVMYQDPVLAANGGSRFIAQPTHPVVMDYYSGSFLDYADANGSAIEVINNAVGISFIASPIATVTGVTMSGGLVAGGMIIRDTEDAYASSSGQAAFSTDGGKSWQELADTPRPIIAVI